MPADEFEVIRTLFAPLATSAGARGLVDDVAVISARGELVVTTDVIVEGVHFMPDDPVGAIAKKALRVNLSDLAGKGAKPAGALLTLVWPDTRPSEQIADFARGLGEDLSAYGIALWGGDTASTAGPMTVSITAFGEPYGARVPSRADARIGDDVWITGTLGDAWLGYLILKGEWDPSEPAHREALIARYRLPSPRTDMAALVARHANASMDVSDGLLGDAAKLAHASGLSLHLELALIPLSEPARAWKATSDGFGRLLDWGDDYEILFTADPKQRDSVAAAAAGARVTRIGSVALGEGVRTIDAAGCVTALEAPGGHAHKLGR
jgi:thiamine-monophosphate kinase